MYKIVAMFYSNFFVIFLMSVYGVLFSSLVAVPIGVLFANQYKLSNGAIAVANIIQTIPALAMVSVLMVVIGLGPSTAVFLVFLYTLLPIIKNTYVGVRDVDRTLLETAHGMGMTKLQILRMVKLPLALPVIVAGIRIALVLSVAITVIGVFVGAGGLGSIIIRGMNATQGTAIILAGVIPSAAMAICLDLMLGRLEKFFTPGKS